MQVLPFDASSVCTSNGRQLFLFNVPNRMDEVCEFTMELPENYDVACGLKKIGKFDYEAADFMS